MKTRYYTAAVDDYGVLCVEPLEIDLDEATEQDAVRLAEKFPKAIYFAVDPPPSPVEVLRRAIITQAKTEVRRWRDTSPESRVIIEAWNAAGLGAEITHTDVEGAS